MKISKYKLSISTTTLYPLYHHFRSQLKHLESERDKLSKLNDALEKKDMEFHKQASDFRVQIIELREANVCALLTQISVTIIYINFSFRTNLRNRTMT